MAPVDHVGTPRLVGRRPVPEDEEALLTIYADEAVAAWLWPGPLGGARTREQVTEIVEVFRAHWRAHGFGPWIFCDRDSGAAVGCCGLRHNVVAGAAEVEVMWSVASSRWGEGLATEMAEACVEVAFGDVDLDEIVAFAVSDNLASQGVMRSAGFTFEREFERQGLPCVVHRRRRSD